MHPMDIVRYAMKPDGEYRMYVEITSGCYASAFVKVGSNGRVINSVKYGMPEHRFVTETAEFPCQGNCDAGMTPDQKVALQRHSAWQEAMKVWEYLADIVESHDVYKAYLRQNFMSFDGI